MKYNELTLGEAVELCRRMSAQITRLVEQRNQLLKEREQLLERLRVSERERFYGDK